MIGVRQWSFVIASTLFACNAMLGTTEAEKEKSPADGIEEPPGAETPGDDDDEDDPGSVKENQDASSEVAANCEAPASDCLDPNREDVLEVPKISMTEAFARVKPGQIIQLRKGTTSGVLNLPPFVTFRGCEGAKLAEGGRISFKGSAATVEGLEVYGQIYANQTGQYVVRGVRCLTRTGVDDAPPRECIVANSIDGLVPASVDLTVEQSYFENRQIGVAAATRYDTLTHEVKLTVRNNVFRKVANPIDVSESGLVGKITASIAFNTFIEFEAAVSLYGTSTSPLVRGNLFVTGKRAVESDSPYTVEYSSAVGLTGTPSTPPVSGSFLALDPKLDAKAIPANTSLVVDAVGTASGADPAQDFRGCPRPRASRSGKALADIGAIER